jgi:hypothetical protein
MIDREYERDIAKLQASKAPQDEIHSAEYNQWADTKGIQDEIEIELTRRLRE